MTNAFKNFSVALVFAVLIQGASSWLESAFLVSFLKQNLATLLIALLAINTTTISVIMTKLRDIAEENEIDFSRTIRSLRESIIEQGIVLAASLIVLILLDSHIIADGPSYVPFSLGVVLVALFLHALHILYDTANGVFVILRHENQASRDQDVKY